MKRDLIWYGGLELVLISGDSCFGIGHGWALNLIGFTLFTTGAFMLLSQRRDA